MTLASGAIGWDHPATARYYELFCTRHRRYDEANAQLIAHAALMPGQIVLDLAAGTGRTAEAALPCLDDGRIDCIEPAAAMRAAGRTRLADRRIRWLSRLPKRPAGYDRILCGAAIWQLLPLERSFARLRPLLAPGGALVFDIPSLYLGVPDAPGGGADPMLLGLAARLAAGATPARTSARPRPLPSPDDVGRLLKDAGFRQAERWAFRLKLDQAALRDWMKIPPITDRLLAGLDPDARARRVQAAWRRCDQGSWRWEGWLGWTAWAGR